MKPRIKSGFKKKQRTDGDPHPYMKFQQEPMDWSDYTGGEEADPFFQNETMSGEEGQLEIPGVPFFNNQPGNGTQNEMQNGMQNRNGIQNGNGMARQNGMPGRNGMPNGTSSQNGNGVPQVQVQQQQQNGQSVRLASDALQIQNIPNQYREDMPFDEGSFDQFEQMQPMDMSQQNYQNGMMDVDVDQNEERLAEEYQQQQEWFEQQQENLATSAANAIPIEADVQYSTVAQRENLEPFIYRHGGRVPASIYSPVTGEPEHELSQQGINWLFKIVSDNEACFIKQTQDGGLAPHGRPPKGCEQLWVEMVKKTTDGRNDEIPHNLLWFYLSNRDALIEQMQEEQMVNEEQVYEQRKLMEEQMPTQEMYEQQWMREKQMQGLRNVGYPWQNFEFAQHNMQPNGLLGQWDEDGAQLFVDGLGQAQAPEEQQQISAEEIQKITAAVRTNGAEIPQYKTQEGGQYRPNGFPFKQQMPGQQLSPVQQIPAPSNGQRNGLAMQQQMPGRQPVPPVEHPKKGRRKKRRSQKQPNGIPQAAPHHTPCSCMAKRQQISVPSNHMQQPTAYVQAPMPVAQPVQASGPNYLAWGVLGVVGLGLAWWLWPSSSETKASP